MPIPADLSHSAGPTPRTRFLRWMRQHPGPRFLVTGGLTFCVDIGALKLLHGEAQVPLVLATVLAYACAFVVNFTLSRQWAFAGARSSAAHAQMVRFSVLVLVNLAVTVLIVSGLSAAGMNYLAAKVVSTAVIATGNFFAYRRWVFR